MACPRINTRYAVMTKNKIFPRNTEQISLCIRIRKQLLSTYMLKSVPYTVHDKIIVRKFWLKKLTLGGDQEQFLNP
jgi:hypothetical protein